MKKLMATLLSWLAFLSGAMVLNVPFFIVLCSKCDMFESKSLYYRITMGYFDVLATLPGEGRWLFFGLSPAIWVLLYFWTGKPRVLPWKK